MAKLLTPEERDAFLAEVKRDGIAIVARRVPKGALKITGKSDDIVAAEANNRPILSCGMARSGSSRRSSPSRSNPSQSWKPSLGPRGKGRSHRRRADPRCRPAERACNQRRARLRNASRRGADVRPSATLYSLDTGMHGLSAEGTSSGWVAAFSTDTPTELLRVMYDDGDIEHLPTGSYHSERPGVPEPDALGYDTKKLYEETVQHAAGVVEPITLVSASLYRSAGSGKALWLLNVYGDDDRIGQTVVFDAKTMKFSHKTKD
jgi:hypothetical protein